VHSEVRCWTFNSAGYDYGHLNARTIKVNYTEMNVCLCLLVLLLLQSIKNVHKQDAVLSRIPSFERAVSRVLRDIKVVRR
jgi:hypothetical protein